MAAKVGKERIDEIADPEQAVNRAKETYSKKDYPQDWIDKRIRGITGTARKEIEAETGKKIIDKNSLKN